MKVYVVMNVVDENPSCGYIQGVFDTIQKAYSWKKTIDAEENIECEIEEWEINQVMRNLTNKYIEPVIWGE